MSMVAKGIGISSGPSLMTRRFNAAPAMTKANSADTVSICRRSPYVSRRYSISSSQKTDSTSALARICPAMPGRSAASDPPRRSSSARSASSRAWASGVTTSCAFTMRSFARTTSFTVSTLARSSARSASVSAALGTSVASKTALMSLRKS